jgi:hypothetical protein
MAPEMDVIAISKSNQALRRQFAVGIVILMKVMNSRWTALESPQPRRGLIAGDLVSPDC